jgi:hypothetical protein
MTIKKMLVYDLFLIKYGGFPTPLNIKWLKL